MGGLCGSSSLAPVSSDGVVPLCFVDIIFLGFTTLFLFTCGLKHMRDVLKTPKQDLRATRLYLSKITVTLFAAALPLLRSAVHIFKGDGELYGIISDFYVSIAWVLSFFLIMFDYSRALRNNWVLRTWWVMVFIAYSFSFQTNLFFSRGLGLGYGIDFFVDLFGFILATYLTTVGLFFNRIPEEYSQLAQENVVDSSDVLLSEKKTSPEEGAGIFSKITFSWLNPLLLLGYKRPIEDSDLYTMPRGFIAQDLDNSFGEIWRKEMSMPKPSLTKSLIRTFGRGFLVAGIFKLGNDLLIFSGPILLQLIIGFVAHPTAPMSVGFTYVAALFFGALIQSICLHQYFFKGFQVGMKVRAALTTAVYRKSFLLSSSARQQSTLGEIVNLQSIDANRLQELTPYLHMLWSAPLQLIVSLVLLWRLLGPSVLAGIFVMALMIPLNTFLAKKLLSIQKRMMTLRDERTRNMNEILNGMRVIKFFAWESSFVDKLFGIRNRELATLKESLFLRAITILFWSTAPVLVAITTFSIYTISGNELTAEKAFTALALFNIIRFPLNMLPNLVSQLVEAKVSVNRIAKFLYSEELDPNAVEKTSQVNTPCAIELENATFKWSSESTVPTLRDVSVKIPRGKLVAIVGAVGSGKSSFLSAVLGEIPKQSGRVVINGSTAFAAQQPWMQNASLRDNILFGSQFNAARYDETIRVCELAQDIAMLPNGDQTEIGEKGINLSGGQKQRVSLARAVYQHLDIYLLDDCLSAVDAHVGKNIFDKCITGVLKNKTRLLITHQLQFVSYADLIIVLRDGGITEMGSYEQLMASKGEFSNLISTHVNKGEEYEKTHEEEVVSDATAGDTGPGKDASKAKPTGKLMTAEEREIGEVDARVWKAYVSAMGGMLVACMVLLGYMLDTGARVGSDYWLSYWSSDPAGKPLGFYLGIYAGLGAISAVVVFIRAIIVNLAGINSARTLHEAMLNRVMRSPMSFFDTTPIGRILNRFSKDVNNLDENLPRTLSMFLSMIFNSLAVVAVIILVTPFFFTALLPLAFFYRHIQKYYLQSSRELKRLESISKSPIYAQFSETLNGLSTIRPYERTNDFISDNNQKIDTNVSAYYILTAANRWLGIRLEFIGNIVVTLAATFAVIEKENLGPGLAGLSISYALQLTTILNWLVRMGTEAETQMVSVERSLHYTNLPVEAPAKIPETSPPNNWPSRGTIQFKDYQLRYREGLELVLKGITLDINAKEKVGVVGRTGAGKSSLMLALFRLVEPADGSICIDGIDISKIGLDDLRKKLSIIPQDPTLFTGTVRSNLDPFGECSDHEVWDCLKSVHMKKHIEGLPQKLESPVTEFGENFSVGQRQLMCLGRALLRGAKILVMDEATAAVDFETDALIQKTIREQFKEVTVLTIAHRIHTIMDYDRVLVLDSGNVAEFGNPQKLANDPQSIFHSLVNKSGTASKKDKDEQSQKEEEIIKIE